MMRSTRAIFWEEWRQCRLPVLLFCVFLIGTGLMAFQSADDDNLVRMMLSFHFAGALVFLMVLPVRASGRDLHLGLSTFTFTLPIRSADLALIQIFTRLMLGSGAMLLMGILHYLIYEESTRTGLPLYFPLLYVLIVMPYIAWAQVFSTLHTGLGLRAIAALPVMILFTVWPVLDFVQIMVYSLDLYTGKLFDNPLYILYSLFSVTLAVAVSIPLLSAVRHQISINTISLSAPTHARNSDFLFQWRFTAQCWFEWKQTVRWLFWIGAPGVISLSLIFCVLGYREQAFMGVSSVFFPILLGFAIGYRLLRCAPPYRHFTMTLPQSLENIWKAKLTSGLYSILLTWAIWGVIMLIFFVIPDKRSHDLWSLCLFAGTFLLTFTTLFFTGRLLILLYLVLLPLGMFYESVSSEVDLYTLNTVLLLSFFITINLLALFLNWPVRRYLPWLSLFIGLVTFLGLEFGAGRSELSRLLLFAPWLILVFCIIVIEAVLRSAVSIRFLLFAAVCCLLLSCLIFMPFYLSNYTEALVHMIPLSLLLAVTPFAWVPLMTVRQRVQ